MCDDDIKKMILLALDEGGPTDNSPPPPRGTQEILVVDVLKRAQMLLDGRLRYPGDPEG